MTANFNERMRYAAYAIVAVLALAVYILSGSPDEIPGGRTALAPVQSEGLPPLRLLEAEGGREPLRDLFAFARAGGENDAPPPVAFPVPAPTGSQPVAPDLLADIQVVGLVRHTDSITVLIHLQSRLITVGLGEKFGAGEALSVQSVEGRNVTITDSTSQKSRIFALSEE
jgi:hypothetical protein